MYTHTQKYICTQMPKHRIESLMDDFLLVIWRQEEEERPNHPSLCDIWYTVILLYSDMA